MSITIELPEETAKALKEAVERSHLKLDELVNEGIKHAIWHAESAEPKRRDKDSLARVHAILRKANFVPPTDEEVKKIKDERIMKKYGYGLSQEPGGK